MGCDIHIYAEKRVGGKWQKATDDIDRGRNYDLFAMLANVRNGTGFAGCDTGDGFKPIAMPKGLPADVSRAVKKESDGWGVDGHSHSWLTVAELLAYDWQGQTTKRRGWVSGSEYKRWKASGANGPDSWCGGVGGGGVQHVSNQEMDRRIASEKDVGRHYTLVEWGVSYADCARDFLSETLPTLRAMGDPEDVRIVFWFDN